MPQNREADLDAAYEAYDRHPLDEPDEWGDLAAFLHANLLHRQEMQVGRERPGP